MLARFLKELAFALGGGGAGSWLTMDYYEGNVPAFGGVDNIPTHLDAAGTEAGQVYTADIVFTSTPFVGEITVPVTMIIMGPDWLLLKTWKWNSSMISPVR